MTRHLIAGAAALAVLGLGFLAWNALLPREREAPVFAPASSQTVPASFPAIIEESPPPEPPRTESGCMQVPAEESSEELAESMTGSKLYDRTVQRSEHESRGC